MDCSNLALAFMRMFVLNKLRHLLDVCIAIEESLDD